MNEYQTDFFTTEQGQFIAGAHRYIAAARILRHAPEWNSRSVMLQTPVLNLLAHGIELLLKFPLLRQGKDQRSLSREFNHDLKVLWMQDANAILRARVLEAAELAWDTNKVSGAWPHDDFSVDPREVLQKAVEDLGFLHGRESSFALRYTIDKPTLAPRPAFLIDAFGDVAERTAMNPAYLDD